MKRPRQTRPKKGNRARLNLVRIIGGSHRGRKISFPDAAGLRPTGDRVRETLFNWLQPYIQGSRCLDAFAGSGGLGFEAASRGAARVVMLESAIETGRILQQNQGTLQLPGVEILGADCREWLRNTPPLPFDIIFLDPPFAQGLLDETLALIANHGWLAEQGLVYVENGKGEAPPVPEGWQLLKEKVAGQVESRLWRNDPINFR
jgi:16S rRNA (guanine966-N2)-methyltransferase